MRRGVVFGGVTGLVVAALVLAAAVLAAAAPAAPAAAAAPAAGAPPAGAQRPQAQAAAGFWTAGRVSEALANPASLAAPPRGGFPATASQRGRLGRAGSLRVAEPSAPGNRTNGRILAFDPREGPYSCSGTSLATPSGSIVLTAGHCVYEGGSWGRNLVFIPAYDGGRRPFGTFVATAVYAMPRWLTFENSDFDVAALRVAPLAGRTLSATVGARPWISGRSRQAPFSIFGYPAGGVDAGEKMRSCAGVGLGPDPHAQPGGPPPVEATCAMGGGSSGGGWLAGEAINGVTSYSYSYSVQPERLYSPYFGAAVARFLAGLP